MNDCLDRGIKEVIEEHPVVGDILNEYEIGCTACTVGTCLLKEVVNIHFLPPEQEEILMKRIEEAILSGKVEKSGQRQSRDPTPNGTMLSYTQPVQMLVDEHKLIKRLLALIPSIVDQINYSGLDRQVILDCVEFIRYYADRFHHAKVEEIMFKYVDESAEVIRVIYADHTTGRGHVQAILKALTEDDRESVIEHLLKYRDLLVEHIKKEDEILYPWIERQLMPGQVEAMYKSFVSEENRLGPDTTSKYEALITVLEEKMLTGEEGNDDEV